MTTVDVDKLESCLGDVLRQVRQEGVPVDVVDHGTVIARVVPANGAAKTTPIDNDAFWDDMEELAEELGKHTNGTVDAVDLIREVRD